jgi:hypothetical protein
MNPPYWVDFYKNAAKGNTPPVIKFSESGPEMTGPPTSIALNLTATVNQPLTLKLWAKDKPNTYDPEEAAARLRSRGRGRGRAQPPTTPIQCGKAAVRQTRNSAPRRVGTRRYTESFLGRNRTLESALDEPAVAAVVAKWSATRRP